MLLSNYVKTMMLAKKCEFSENSGKMSCISMNCTQTRTLLDVST